MYISANLNRSNLEVSFLHKGCEAWGRLHTEREDVCEALLKEATSVRNASSEQESDLPAESMSREMQWRRREVLQARLRQIDDALDRLMAGAYGRCSDCGTGIEEKRLSLDPAASLCLACQTEREGEKHFRTM
jgi:DnaK suppressor protein